MTAWTPGQQLVFERNPHWWGPPPEMERRAGYYREIQEIVWQAVPIIPLHTIKVVVLTRANITGLVV